MSNGAMSGLAGSLYIVGFVREASSRPVCLLSYVDGLVNQVTLCGFGCYTSCTCISILLNADDILLLALSIAARQLLLSVCERN